MNREARKNANRQKLIEATIDSIAELGLSDTTVGTVVKRAGLSQGIVNLHFDTKEALLAETLKFLSVEWEAAWRERLDRAGPDPAGNWPPGTPSLPIRNTSPLTARWPERPTGAIWRP
jgi:TetR/AcrR family transcriptional repressor of bet genes